MALKHIAAAVAALALVTSAQASSSVTVSLTDFNLSVDQGSFAWTSGAAQSYALYTVSSDKPFFTPSLIDQNGTSGSLFGSDSISTSLTTSAKGVASAGAASLSAAATTGAAGGSAYSIAQWNGAFDLAANSRVTFSWKSSSVGLNDGDIGSFGYSIIGFSDGYQSIDHYYPVTAGNWSTLDQGVTYSFWTVGDTHYASLSTIDGASGLAFHARVEAATNDITAVPEPESMALALGGVGVIGFVARRRRQA